MYMMIRAIKGCRKAACLWGLLCLTLFLTVSAPPALASAAGAAEDITALCEISPRSPRHGLKSLFDRKYTTPWETGQKKNPYVQFTLPEGKTCASLYVCFGKMPSSWEVQTQEGEKWVTVAQGDTRYLHAYMELPNVKRLRIVALSEKKTSLLLNEVFLFGPGQVPDWVQKWQPTEEKADLLLLVAHPDDELIYLGGTIPYYAVEQKRKVVVCYLTASNTTRSSELLNGLWDMGMHTYPVIGTFWDSYSSTLKEAYQKWKKNQVRDYVVSLLRKYRPEVVVSHDVEGEYGHGAHRLCADAAIWSVENASKTDIYPESAAQYGVWDVKKLYLHLYPENQITMNWLNPSPALSERTPLQAAQDAYDLHVTQHRTNFEVLDAGKYDNSLFGLVRTLVGPDEAKNDFLENIS